MKEFQKKIKTVVKRHAPDKEQIRRTVKGEVSIVVASPKAERSFSVGSLAAVAVTFILFVGIVVGSVLVEQTRKPAVSGVGSSDTETTNTKLPDPDAIDLNNVYPLNYQTSENIPLWEDRTTEEELAERLNRKEIVFADSELSFKESETIEDVVWEARDFDNVTTRELYDTCNCEFVWIRGNVFILDGKTLHLATENFYEERDRDSPLVLMSVAKYLISAHYVPCAIGDSGTILIHFGWYFMGSGTCYGGSEIISYDMKDHSWSHLFKAHYMFFNYETASYLFVNNTDLSVEDFLRGELSNPKIPYGKLAIEKREENADGASYRILAVSGEDDTIREPIPMTITKVYGYTPVGDLHYDGKMKAWSFEELDLPYQASCITSLKIVYCGNSHKALTIYDQQEISKLMAFIINANGTVQEETTRGYYGVPYSITIEMSDGETVWFHLWDDDCYSSSVYPSPDGYEYFYSADMSAMYNYLKETYEDIFLDALERPSGSGIQAPELGSDPLDKDHSMNEDGTHKIVRLMEWDGKTLQFCRVLWGDGVALCQAVEKLTEGGYVERKTDITIDVNTPDYDYPADKGTVWLCFDDTLYRIEPDGVVVRLKREDYLGGGTLMGNAESLIEFLKQMERISE